MDGPLTGRPPGSTERTRLRRIPEKAVLDRDQLHAVLDAGLYCRADDRGDPVIQLAPPLIIGPAEFDDIEQRLRGVLTEAWSRL